MRDISEQHLKLTTMAALISVFTLAGAGSNASAQTPGSVTQYTAPTPLAGPCNAVQGPDGQMWFVEVLAHKVARIDAASGNIQEFTIPNTLTIPPQPLLPLLGLSGLAPLNSLL